MRLADLWTALLVVREVRSFAPSSLANRPSWRLLSSVSIPTDDKFIPSAFEDDDDNHFRDEFLNSHSLENDTIDEDSLDFGRYLKALRNEYGKDFSAAAIRVDLELKHMAERFANRQSDDGFIATTFETASNDPASNGTLVDTTTTLAGTPSPPECRSLHIPVEDLYSGPIVEPNIGMYTRLVNYYGRAQWDAQFVFDLYNFAVAKLGSEQISNFFQASCLKAVAQLGDWNLTDTWFQSFPDENPENYAAYLDEMAHTTTLRLKEVRRRVDVTMSKVRQNPSLQTRAVYMAAMKCVARERLGLKGVRQMRRMLEELSVFHDTQNPRRDETKPTVLAYLLVVRAAANCRRGLEGARLSKEFLVELQQIYNDTKDEDLAPIEPLYSNVFRAYSRVHPQDREKMESEVDRLWEEFQADDKLLSSASNVYTSLVQAMCNTNSIKRLDTAKDILLKAGKKPKAQAYEWLAVAYLRRGAVEQADDLLLEHHRLSQKSKLQPPKPALILRCIVAWTQWYHQNETKLAIATTNSLNLGYLLIENAHLTHLMDVSASHTLDRVMRLLALNSWNYAGSWAEKFITARQHVHQEHSVLGPTLLSYTLAIEAWVASKDPQAGSQALRILRMIREQASEGAILPANVRTLFAVIKALMLSKQKYATEVWDLFQEIIHLYGEGDRAAELCGFTEADILKYLAKNGPPQQCIQIRDQLLDLAEATGEERVIPSTRLHNLMLSALCQRGCVRDAISLLEAMESRVVDAKPCSPDRGSYSHVIRGIILDQKTSRSLSTTSSGLLIEGYLRKVQQYHESNGIPIDTLTRLYNTAMAGYSLDRTKEALDRAEKLLLEMETGPDYSLPDVYTYAKITALLGSLRSPSINTKIYGYLGKVQKLQTSTNIRPSENYSFYSAAIEALARAQAKGCMKVAETILEDMRGSNSPPTQNTYESLLNGWAKAITWPQAKMESCSRAMERMVDEGLSPTTKCHNAAILASLGNWRRNPEQRASDFAKTTRHFRAIHESEACKPDTFTYVLFLRACRTLVNDPENKAAMIAKVFRLCQKDGLVNRHVIMEVQRSQRQMVNESLAEYGCSLSTEGVADRIPKEWQKNCD